MSRDYNDLMESILKINVDRFGKSVAHLACSHREALGIHEWFDIGEAAGFLKALQTYALDQKARIRPTDTGPQQP